MSTSFSFSHQLRICVMVIGTFLLSIQLKAQVLPYPPEVQARITRVEEGLVGAIQTQDTIRWSLKDRMAFHKIPGVSIAVINNYQLEWAGGYGWADKTLLFPVTTQTRFQAASISKSLNGVGILKLVQDKQLDINADINQYLRSWNFPYDSATGGKKITIAHLLSHTAGLTVHGFPGYAISDTLPRIIDILDGKRPANTKAVRSQFAPGLRYQYSGGGTVITQLLVEDQTGKSYEKYQWEKVLNPLGMINSSYEQPSSIRKPGVLATGHYTNGSEVKGKYHIYPEKAPAGLWTTPTDLAKYIIEMQLCIQGNAGKVLSAASTRLMLTPFIDAAAGLGVFINQKGEGKYFQHGGANEGFRCQYFGSMENGKGVVVMVNSDNGNIIPEIINSVALAYGWKGYYTPMVRTQVTTPAVELLDSYTGQYQLSPQFILDITREGNQLKLQATGQDQYDIFPEAVNKFFLKVVDARITFVAAGAGAITKAILSQGGRDMEAKKTK